MTRRIPWGAVLVALLLTPAAAAAQDAVITGRVQSGSMAPAAGAVITIPSLNITTVTNDVGQYRLVVPAAQVRGQTVAITVSLLGYETHQANIALNPGAVRRDFTLQERAIALDQILVTGTAGQLERRAQSGVIASINAAQVTDVAPIQTVGELLQSRVSGVSVSSASGTSGTAQTIRIRGRASISLSNEPLVFIDGVRADARISQLYGVGGQAGSRLNDIPPEDIESIEIVKGPAAATLYGADASAGVIHIITKRGRTGARFSQSLTAEYHSLDANFTPPANWGACNAAAVNRTVDTRTGEPLTLADNPCMGQAIGTIVSDNPLVRTNAFRTGQTQSLAWSGRGGGEAYNYFVSLASENEDGTLPNNFYGRTGGQMSFDFLPRRDLRIEGGLGLTRTQTDLPQNDNNIYGFLGGGLLGSPLSRGLANDGWYAGNRQVEAITNITNLNRTLRTRPRLAVNYTPFTWMTNRLILGADLSRTQARFMYPRNDNVWYGTADLNSGQVGEARQNYDIFTIDYLGNLTHRLNEDIRADLSFGTQFITESNDVTNATGTGLITNAARAINAAARATGGGSYSEEKSIGVFGQLQLAFFDRLYPQIALRADRHSATGRDAGIFLSPTIGLSYVASDEPAVRNMLPDAISTLRLRTRWGTTGRSPSGGALQTYSAQPFLITATTIGSGVVQGNPGNRELKPERGEEIEIGMDVGMLNERLGLELTYFNKTSKDLVLARPLAPSAGFTSASVLQNIGELVNRGIEVAAVAQLVQRPNFAWEQRIAMNTLHNEVTDLGEVSPFGSLNRVEQGFQPYAFFVNPILSVDAANNRAVVRDSLEFYGNLLPSFEGNTSAMVSLFNVVRLYGQLDWKHDFYIYNNTDQFRERQFGTGERWVRRNEMVESGEMTDDERIRRFGPFVREDGTGIAAGNVNEMYVEPGDFYRLREISATISLPRDWAELFRSQGASITFAGRNLALWTKYTGPDPEINSATAANSRMDFLTAPPARRFVTRINLQF
jgi:TonB-dependent starch-binding outer membrane protein SusC